MAEASVTGHRFQRLSQHSNLLQFVSVSSSHRLIERITCPWVSWAARKIRDVEMCLASEAET